MAYYPKNRIETNLYTNGGEYSVSITGQEYVGYYYKLYNGTYFTGKTPNDKPNQELIPLVDNQEELNDDSLTVIVSIEENKTRDRYIGLLGKNPENKKLPTPYYPKPTEQDYKLGEIQRYFSKKINDNIFIEIDKSDFDNLSNEDSSYLWEYYITFSIPWEITGKKEEAEHINKRITALAEANNKTPGFRLFIQKIGGYLKFYK